MSTELRCLWELQVTLEDGPIWNSGLLALRVATPGLPQYEVQIA